MVPITKADMKESGWKVCALCPALKFLPRQMAAAGWMNMMDYINPYVTDMDKKPKHLHSVDPSLNTITIISYRQDKSLHLKTKNSQC